MAKRLHNPPRFDKNLIACQYQAALKAVDMFFHDMSKSELWMISTNPLLGNISPNAMLNIGRFDKLMNFIYTQIRENKV